MHDNCIAMVCRDHRTYRILYLEYPLKRGSTVHQRMYIRYICSFSYSDRLTNFIDLLVGGIPPRDSPYNRLATCCAGILNVESYIRKQIIVCYLLNNRYYIKANTASHYLIIIQKSCLHNTLQISPENQNVLINITTLLQQTRKC